MPFPPLLLADDGYDEAAEAERVRRWCLKAKYDEMHEAFEHGEYASLDEFLRVRRAVPRRVLGDSAGRRVASVRACFTRGPPPRSA